MRAFLIDGTAFCYRAFHGVRVLSTTDGRPTNAVFGFAKMLQALQAKERPDYLAVAFDTHAPTFRHRQFEAYKAQRKPMPDGLIAQIPTIKELLAAYRIPVFECPGYEAEDVLATLAKRIAPGGVEVMLVTGDKDALQLVNSHIKVYNPDKDELVLDADAVKARYGIGPEQMVDLLALMGDTADNIPSVPGIGEKTASQLLQQFGSVDALYRRLDEVESPSRRASLEQSREQVRLSLELARITTEAPVTATLDDLKPQEPDWRAVRTLFRQLEFKKLLEELDRRHPGDTGPGRDVRSLGDPAGVDAFLSATGTRPASIWCLEGADGTVWIALAPAADGPAWVGAVTGDDTKLSAWLADPKALKLSHDGKAACRALGHLGMRLEGIAGDTMLAAYLLNPARTQQTLSDVADEHLDAQLGAAPGLPAGGLVADPAVEQYLARGVMLIGPLHELLAGRLGEIGLDRLYAGLELPLLRVLAKMEAAGIAVDTAYLGTLRRQMGAKIEGLAREIYALAGGEFNLNSPKQLSQILFERLKLPVIKRTKTGISTDSDVLQRLAAQHPLPEKLIQYRELSKLVSTYVEALPQLVDPATGRLHTSLNQAATATGRLSSSNPNLQNIPIKTELGRSIRKAFVPAPGQVMLAADYSQVELRILAHLSGDEQLREAFRQGRDIHRFTASLIYGIPEADVRPEQRSAMKAINFGIVYGMSAYGLSQELKIPAEEAQAFIDAYFQRYPAVQGYLQSQIAKAKTEGYVETMAGRRRYVPELKSADGMLRQVGERIAINAPIQGTAADVIKRAMVDLDARITAAGLPGRMLLQVHDELVFETPESGLGELAALVRQTMEHAIELSVPLTVTLKAGPNWVELSPLK